MASSRDSSSSRGYGSARGKTADANISRGKGTAKTAKENNTTPGTSAAPARNTQYNKPSHRLNPKTIDPFNKKGSDSVFASAYSSGGVPCRLVHGSVKHKLQWSTVPEELEYDPLLITFAEGLKETVHPYAFVANTGFIQMLMVEDAEQRTLPVLPRLISPIKAALMSPNNDCFISTMNALVQLSTVVTSALNPHLKSILPQISRRLSSKHTKEHVLICLQKIEYNGGSESTCIIKSRIPTYSSVL